MIRIITWIILSIGLGLCGCGEEPNNGGGIQEKYDQKLIISTYDILDTIIYLDTVSIGDTFLVWINPVKTTTLNKTSSVICADDIGPSVIIDSTLEIYCDKRIVIGTDTINVGENMYSSTNRALLNNSNYSTKRAIYMKKEVLLIPGKNMFYMRGRDTKNEMQLDTCWL